jgi:hypothetical protein
VLQKIVIDTTPKTTTNELKRPLLNPPSVHALIKLSKYIPEGTVNPDILLPGSLNAKNNIEKNGYNTIIDPIKNIE